MSRPRNQVNVLPYLIPAIFVLALSLAVHSGLSGPSQASSSGLVWEGPVPTSTANAPGVPDTSYSDDGKATLFGTASTFLIESACAAADGSVTVNHETLTLGDAAVTTINYHGTATPPHSSPCTFGCSPGNQDKNKEKGTEGITLTYSGGMFNNEAAIYSFDGASFSSQVLDLGPGTAAVPGIEHLGGTRFAVAGFADQDFVFVDVDTSQPPPYNRVVVDVGTNDFGFDVGFPPDAGSGGSDEGYAVGRAGSFLVLCKAAFPGATLVTGFGSGGCISTTLGGTTAEGREVDVLTTGEVVVAGVRDNRFVIAVFDGTTGDLVADFDGDGIWQESLPGSTESQGWSVVGMSRGFAALGWAEVGGQREVVIPVFDGLEPDTRYPNGGTIRQSLLSPDAFPISLQLSKLPPITGTNLQQPYRWLAAGTESGYSQGFVWRFGAVLPTQVFTDGFESGDLAAWSKNVESQPAGKQQLARNLSEAR